MELKHSFSEEEIAALHSAFAWLFGYCSGAEAKVPDFVKQASTLVGCAATQAGLRTCAKRGGGCMPVEKPKEPTLV